MCVACCVFRQSAPDWRQGTTHAMDWRLTTLFVPWAPFRCTSLTRYPKHFPDMYFAIPWGNRLLAASLLASSCVRYNIWQGHLFVGWFRRGYCLGQQCPRMQRPGAEHRHSAAMPGWLFGHPPARGTGGDSHRCRRAARRRLNSAFVFSVI